ncbi:hypothetical protein [Amycolatopsis sp. NPDC051371]|uniref:TRADD-N-associated membrane domain-containing protein n=1 Tax=Amycolatopsis sp. NPDC051371 TaxID=3155800 RepID=UPI00343CBBFB
MSDGDDDDGEERESGGLFGQFSSFARHGTADKRQMWRKSPERKSFRRLTVSVTAIALLTIIAGKQGLLLLLRIFDPAATNSITSWTFENILAFCSILSFFIARWKFRQAFSEFSDRYDLELALSHVDASVGGERDSNAHDLTLTDLWHQNQERLSAYHTMATGQAAKSYRNGQNATVAGFVVLLFSVIFASVTSSLTGALAAGGIGAVGAVLTAYLTRTFLRMHESSSRQLRSYFDQPVDLSRILAAERLLNMISDDARRGEAIVELIRTNNRLPAETVDGSEMKLRSEPGS